MGIAFGSYPHPVLGNSDDVESTFEITNVAFSAEVDSIEIEFRLESDDFDLFEGFRNGSMKVMARWDCAVTLGTGYLELFQSMISSDCHRYYGFLDQSLVRDDVRIDVFVVAQQDIPRFRWACQHADYGNSTFDILQGDILAVGGSFVINAVKRFDPMDPPVGSCFRFTVDPQLKRELEVDFHDEDQVVIRISDEMANGIKSLSTQSVLLQSIVVIPVLIETISFIQSISEEENDQYKDMVWFRTIGEMIAAYGQDARPLEIAQKIMEGVIAKALTTPFFDED